MLEDRHMMRFIYILLGIASIFIPGPIISSVSFIIATAILVNKIKKAKESPEGYEALMLDIIIIVIIIVADIGAFAMKIAMEKEYNKLNFSSKSTQQETNASDFAESAILSYKIENISQFFDEGNNLNEIKSGFNTFLNEELNITNTTINGNKITCSFGKDTIVFTVTKNDIEYKIK